MLISFTACKSGSKKEKDENVITFSKQTSGSVQQNILGPLGESWEDNRWIKKFEEELNLQVKYDWLVDSGQYFEKLNLMMSRMDLPDVFLTDNNRLYELYEADCIQPLDDLFEEYASDELKAYFADAGQEMWDAATIDGHLYAIPNLYSPLDRLQYLWIRTDWLKKLNLSEPKNFEDVLAISTAFTKNDPDGNGKNDTYGFGVRGKPDIWREYYSMTGLFSAFGGMAPRLVVDENGVITKSENTAANKYALEQIAKLVAKKEIDPNFSTLSEQQVTEAIGQNKIGMFFGEHWVPQTVLNPIYKKMSETNPDYEWKAFPIYDMEGNYAKQSVPLSCNGWYVINKDYEHPENLIKMMNVYVKACEEQPEYYMDSAEIKSIWSISPISLMSYNSNIEIYDQICSVIDGETDYNSVTKNIQSSVDILKKWDKNKDPDSWSWHTIYDKDGAMSVLKQYLENDVPYGQDYYYKVPESASNFGSVLDQLRDQLYLDVILGKKDISAFETYKTNWLASGGQMMLDDINKIYREIKK